MSCFKWLDGKDAEVHYKLVPDYTKSGPVTLALMACTASASKPGVRRAAQQRHTNWMVRPLWSKHYWRLSV
jgi:hypothetical protein